jgi:hypothetical protein
MEDRNESGSGVFVSLKRAAPILLWAGALGSAGLTLMVGRRNSSVGLIAMFVVWVLSPFVGLWWARRASVRWSNMTNALLYRLIPIVALGSLVVYARVVLGPLMVRPAMPFLMVPLVSWVLIVGVLPAAACVFGRRKP